MSASTHFRTSVEDDSLIIEATGQYAINILVYSYLYNPNYYNLFIAKNLRLHFKFDEKGSIIGLIFMRRSKQKYALKAG